MAISFVNINNNGAFANTITLGSIVVGNLIVLWARFFGLSSAPTLTDSQGNSFTLGVDFQNGSSRCCMWYCLAATATSAGISFSAVGSFPEMLIEQWNTSTGTWSWGGSPVTGIGTQSSPTWNSGAKTVSVGDLVFGLFENESTNGITFSTSGSWTYRGDSQGNVTITDRVAASTSETPALGSNTTVTGNAGTATINFSVVAPPSSNARTHVQIIG